jgi:hypothetical protein
VTREKFEEPPINGAFVRRRRQQLVQRLRNLFRVGIEELIQP